MHLQSIEGPASLKGLSLDDMKELAAEIRSCLIDRVTLNGGHLASNLGVVELTLALHYVFDSPKDAIVWDVGHQAYVHKLLTGRYDQFARLRQYGGLSGFCTREESPHDPFGAGHAGTSISAALGLAVGRDLRGEPGRVVAVIGDGSLTCGLAFEGLENVKHLGFPLVVVLNDNGMSISPNVGAMSSYLAQLRTSRPYYLAKARTEHALTHLPLGGPILKVLRRFAHAVLVLFLPTVMWEQLGFHYVGPLDGHDLEQMIDAFSRVRDARRPLLVHVVTIKGKGHPPAEADAATLHMVAPRNSLKSNGLASPTYSAVFGRTLVELARCDPRIVAITAAMPDGTGLAEFARQFPRRFFDVGIAEGHAVTFGAGLAAAGLRPVVAIYSTFLQRAYDSVLHDVCLQKLPVVFALDRAGLVGEDGRTHHGLLDLTYLRSLPGLTVMTPRDEGELQRMLRAAIALPGPVAIRYPRGPGHGVRLDEAPITLDVGRAAALRDGTDLTIIAVGSMVYPSLAAAEELESAGISAAVLDAQFVWPLDETAILTSARATGFVVTVEENVLAGGFGSAVAELFADQGLGGSVLLHRIGLPDSCVEHGSQLALREAYGLYPRGIANSVRAWLLEVAHSSHRRTNESIHDRPATPVPSQVSSCKR